MSDPAVHVGAQIRYEIQLLDGPIEFNLNGVNIAVASGLDVAVIARVTMTTGDVVVDRTIVGVIGDRGHHGSSELLNIVWFLNGGGVIGLSPYLCRAR